MSILNTNLTRFCKLVVATIVLLAAIQVAEAATNANELAKKLEGANVLQKGYKCSVAIDKNIAVISTYQNMTSKNPDHDCKIDAVLLARKAFEFSPDLTRVKVKLFDPRGTGASRTVSLSVGDIAAFSAGKVEMQKLLSSLEVVHETAPSAKPAANTKTEAIAAKNKNSSSSSTKASSSSSGTASSTEPSKQGEFHSALVPVSLRYPPHWTVSNHPDHETEVSIAGANRKGQVADLRFIVNDALPPDWTPEQYSQTVENEFKKSIKGIHQDEESHVNCGHLNSVAGVKSVYSFESKGIPMIQQHLFFKSDGKNCWLQLTTPGWSPQDARTQFAEILTTLDCK